jgi:hypothetical protein
LTAINRSGGFNCCVGHCDGRGHYFRKTKKEFDQTIESFVKRITVAPEYIEALMGKIGSQLEKQLLDIHKDATAVDLRIANLQSQIRQSVDKIKFLNSETAIKYMEEDIEAMEVEIVELKDKRSKMEAQKPQDIAKASAYVRYFLEHLDALLLHHQDPLQQARYFGVLFNKAPTYTDLESGTPKFDIKTEVNSVFQLDSPPKSIHGWG